MYEGFMLSITSVVIGSCLQQVRLTINTVQLQVKLIGGGGRSCRWVHSGCAAFSRTLVNIFERDISLLFC